MCRQRHAHCRYWQLGASGSRLYVSSKSRDNRLGFTIADPPCTDSAASSYMWSQIEPSAAILCACIVTYRPLFRDLHLPSFITRMTSQKAETSDVSRRWPSNDKSEKGSETELISNQSRIGRSMPVNAWTPGNRDAKAATPDDTERV